MSAALRLAEAVALGAGCGLLGGVFGVGGGLIAIPLLGIFYDLPQQTAQGTTLVMVAPNVLLAFWRYRQRVGVDLRLAGTLGLSALVAAYPAARLAAAAEPHALRLAFAVFLAVLALIGVARSWQPGAKRPAERELSVGWASVIGVVGGFVSGFFGVGGAFIVPPTLTTFFAVRQIEAQGLALALVCPSTITAMIGYAGAGHVEWGLGLPLALGGVMAISTGVAVAHRLPERQLRLGFSLLLLTTSSLLALHG